MKQVVRWAAMAVAVVAVFALGLWIGGRGLKGAIQPAPQVSVTSQGSTLSQTEANIGQEDSQSPSNERVIPTPEEPAQVPLPPVNSINIEPEAAAVKGDPDAPVTVVEYSDYQ